MSSIFKQLVRGSSLRETEQTSQLGSTASSPRTTEQLTASVQPDLLHQLFPNGQTYGLLVLYNPSNPIVDLIFVHGLTGNSYSTWLKRDSETYWPVHLLSKDVPDARIMAFGYDADVMNIIGPVSQNKLADHAMALLEDLANLRSEDNSENRKIILVVHSLGGLVLKKALCLSEQTADTHLNQLSQNTIAVAFLGTPHRGSSIAPFATSIAKILAAAGIRANPEILGLLNRDSEVLRELENAFGNWLRKNSNRFQLTCFYEELERPAPVGMVVTKESATISGYPQVSIHADHMGISRFTIPSEQGYVRICGNVKRWLRPIRSETPELSREEEADSVECLKSLSFREMSDRAKYITPPVNGSGTWLSQHPAYNDWLSTRRGLLCIKGKPGIGKSTLMKFCTESTYTTRPSEEPVILSFFFHGRGSELQKTPLGLFRSLSHQLLLQFPRHCSSITQIFRHNLKVYKDGNWDWHERELLTSIESSLLKILNKSSVRVFVDALDECGEREATKLVTTFQQWDSRFSTTPYGLSLCFSCRHYPILAPEKCNNICVEDQSQHLQDVRIFMEALRKDNPKLEELQHDIEVQSRGVFQWVVLVTRQIISMFRNGKTQRQARDALKNLPQELNDLYKMVVDDLLVEDRAQSLKLFQWLCFALRPLSMAELRCAMNVDASPKYLSFRNCRDSLEYIENVEQMEIQLHTLSGGLAEWKNYNDANQPVAQLVHQSVRDYLINQGGFDNLDQSMNSEDEIIRHANSRLSRSCIIYFDMEEVRKSYQSLGDSPEQTSFNEKRQFRIKRIKEFEKEYPLLDYSVCSWTLHLQAINQTRNENETLLDCLHRRSVQTVQHWLRLQYEMEMDVAYPHGITILHLASYYNLVSLVSAILDNTETGGINIDAVDNKGLTALSWAAEIGHEAVVQLLLEKGKANVNSKTMVNGKLQPLDPIWEAIKRDFITKLPGGREFGTKNTGGWTPLFLAANRGHEAVVKLLIETGEVEINLRDASDWTPLAVAAHEGHEGVLKLLLDTGTADVDPKDYNGWTPLSWAARRGHAGVVKLLLSSGKADVDSKDTAGRTPLWWAQKKGHKAVVKLLENKMGKLG